MAARVRLRFEKTGARTEKRKNYTAMELFARCDGLSCSFGRLGFSVVSPRGDRWVDDVSSVALLGDMPAFVGLVLPGLLLLLGFFQLAIQPIPLGFSALSSINEIATNIKRYLQNYQKGGRADAFLAA